MKQQPISKPQFQTLKNYKKTHQNQIKEKSETKL